jgi:uncharacterized membrane protein YkvA (DUF1232 family)
MFDKTNEFPEKEYEKKYSKEALFNKIKKFAKNAGIQVIYAVLLLYYVLKEDVPIWAKSTILGSLGYFISPIDAIPDITPVVGYSDDLAVLAIALATVASFIDANVKDKAKNKLRDWFNDFDDEDLEAVNSKIKK